MKRFLAAAVIAALCSSAGLAQRLMPLPHQITKSSGALILDSSFVVSLADGGDAMLKPAVHRLLKRLIALTGIQSLRTTVATDNPTTFNIICQGKSRTIPSAVENESYTLEVGSRVAVLNAATRFGVLRGLETLLQLIELGGEGFHIPAMTIQDQPRFPWRGLLLDACRHWMPVEVIKRNLDGMAAVKMNVLHWHLSEDQGFRVESKKFPKLHELGSDGNYYTQEQIKEVIAYAAERGIRVVPEFDMPGHATAWFVGYPELASAPGPYQIERRWGIFDPTMDPTKERTYKFLDEFIGEMARLFPDEYFHIGGDEVNGNQWSANAEMILFRGKHNLKDNHALQAYFNRRLLTILQRHGKKMIGWDEIFHPTLPKNIVIQSWRGHRSLAEGAQQGYAGILSHGYYLDHMKSAAFHYAVDPIDTMIADLDDDAQRRILGGEACMWAEYVSPENVDSRIWPRTAAIAERLWSRSSARDSTDMYRRLAVVSRHLELVGLTHRTSYTQMLERLAGNNAIEPLKVLADVLEPVKNYERGRTRMYTQFTPLNRLVDAVRPESNVAREFMTMSVEHKRERLLLWASNHAKLQPILHQSVLLQEIEPLSKNLSDVAEIGLRVYLPVRQASDPIEVLRQENKTPPLSPQEKMRFKEILDSAAKSTAGLELKIVDPIKRMFEAVSK
jgi:hexosaminidase